MLEKARFVWKEILFVVEETRSYKREEWQQFTKAANNMTQKIAEEEGAYLTVTFRESEAFQLSAAALKKELVYYEKKTHAYA